MSSSSGFTGFAAFANHTSVASAAVAVQKQKRKQKQKGKATHNTTHNNTSNSNSNTSNNNNTGTGAPTTNKKASIIPSPIYTGSNAQITQIYKRLSKKDGITKTRALDELAQLYSNMYANHNHNHNHNHTSSTNSTNSTNTISNITKKDLLTAASHYYFLLSHKIIHEDDYHVNGSVRNAALLVWKHMIHCIPKACYTLLCHDHDVNVDVNVEERSSGGGNDDDDDSVGAVGNLMGWIYTLQCSQLADVSKTAMSVWKDVVDLLKKYNDTDSSSSSDGIPTSDGSSSAKSLSLSSSVLHVKAMIQTNVLQHIQSILASSSRPINLHQALSVLSKSKSNKGGGGGGNDGGGSGSGNKKNKKQQKGTFMSPSLLDPAQRAQKDAIQEKMEEKYIRVILSCLHGAARFFQEYPEGENTGTGTGTYVQKMSNPSILWKHIHNNQRATFRRATYALVSSIAQHAPSLLFGGEKKDSSSSSSSSMSTNVLQQLTSERDPANIAPLLELMIIYFSSHRTYTKHVIWCTTTTTTTSSSSSSTSSSNSSTRTSSPHVIQAEPFTKSLSKVIKRACYGSHAESWTPLMLPMIASLSPFPSLQWTLLSALWYSSRDHKTLGNSSGGGGNSNSVGGEGILIVMAVTECALYLLLQKRNNHQSDKDEKDEDDKDDGNDYADDDDDDDDIQRMERDLAMNMAQTFLQCLTYYLTQPMTGGMVVSVPPSLSLSSSTNNASSTQTPQARLLQTLVRDLNKLNAYTLLTYSSAEENENSKSETYCMFDHVQAWFWSEGMMEVLGDDFDDDDNNDTNGDGGYIQERLSALLNRIREKAETGEKKKKDEQLNRNQVVSLYHSLRHHVWHSIVPNPTTKSMPTLEALRLLMSLFQFCGLDFIFEEAQMTMEVFCKEYVVTWVCTGPPSSRDRFQDWMATSFEILFLILQNVGGDDRLIWTYLLQQMNGRTLNSKVETLTVGLSTMLSLATSQTSHTQRYGYDEIVELIQCDELDHVAIQVAKESEKTFMLQTGGYVGLENDDDSESDFDHDDNDEDEIQQTHASSFLRLCAAVGKHSSPKNARLLVRSHVIESWTNTILSSKAQSATDTLHQLMDVILSVARVHPLVIKGDTVLKIIVRSWEEGGPTWQRAVDEFVSIDKTLHDDLVRLCSMILKQDIKNGPESEHESVYDAAFLWSRRAWRLVELCSKNLSPSSSESPALHLVGLGDVEVWTAAAGEQSGSIKRQYLYQCLINVMRKFSGWKERQMFLWTNETSFFDFKLTSQIFMTLVMGEKGKVRQCDELLTLLGGVMQNEDRVVSYILPMIDFVSDAMKDAEGAYCVLENGVAILDWFLGLILSKFIPVSDDSSGSSDDIKQTDVKEGDEVWYVLDGTKNDSRRIKVTVVKVHTDDFPNLYFTIQYLNETGENITKQTIARRLKKQEHSPLLEMPHPTVIRDKGFIQKVEDKIVQKIVKPFIEQPTGGIKDIICEVINSTISHCGLQGKGGIGTTRFEAIQAISKLSQDVLTNLSGESIDPKSIAPVLKRLSIALGYGTLTSASSFNCDFLMYDGQPILDSLRGLLDMDDSINYFRGPNGNQLRIAILMWLTMATKVTMKEENAATMWELVDILSSVSVDEETGDRTTHDTMLMMTKACKELNHASSILPDSIKSTFIALKQAFMSNLLAIFILCSDEGLDHDVGEHNGVPRYYTSFKSLVMDEVQNDPGAILHAARVQAEGLVDCLESPIKQWFAFHILFECAQSGHMLYTEDKVTLGESTAELLYSWQDGLEEEEAMEIEGDVLAAAQWLPQKLMSQIEQWEVDIDHDEKMFISHLLRWILCLEYFDAAGKADMRHRAQITSYIDKTGAVQELFQVVMSFAQLKKQESSNLFKCIKPSSSEAFSIEDLSTLAIFRTIESMPTLCKSWWNDECPRAHQSEVNRFVESMVAPETLRRELDRIHMASNLGELTVRGSCVSREVVATYIQDECKLSVVIRVPPTFPLRNVEVDCQKTLGVNEKRWRHWSLQIMRMLNGQDGSILDALLLWKQNVDKEFDGVEPCPICYSVVCVKTHAMPNLECKTCHNRFHSSCLYKWFHSSGKHQCPLCQQPWSGTKVA